MEPEHRPLADLIRQRQERWSYREMSERARRAGKSISHSQLADYAADVVRKAPDIEQMEAIAVAVDMGFEEIRGAVFEQFFGYIPRELKRPAKMSKIMTAIPSNLSPEEEAQLLRMVEAWLASRQDNP